MQLPNGSAAVIDPAKLAGYCLDPAHPTGKHKARVFADALGFTSADADRLRKALADAAADGDATPGTTDAYGRRFTIDLEMAGRRGLRATVRSAWIIRAGDIVPRLTTCYVL